MQRISKFLRVVSDESMPDERGVMSNDNKLIAIIGYYKPWREWVLYPQPNTVWSTDCLVAIKSHLAWMSKVVQGPNTPHHLRHAYATHCLNAGQNPRAIQQAMGHSQLETTMVYLHAEALSVRSPLEFVTS